MSSPREILQARRLSERRGTLRLALGFLGAALMAAAGAAAERRDIEADLSPARSLAAPPSAAPAAVGPRVALLWFDPRESLPGGFETVREEVVSIFRGIGVDVRWTLGGLGTVFGDSDVPEIPVILLPEDPAPSRADRRIMGLVIRNQAPSRAVWVFLDSVRWTLGHDLRRRSKAASGEIHEAALAVARVVAHEVVHAIAPEEPHARGGLMSHSLNRRFLLGQRAPVDPQCAAAFLTRLAELLAAPEAPAAALRLVPVAGP